MAAVDHYTREGRDHRLLVEDYLGRIDRHIERAQDDLYGLRRRIAFAQIEVQARGALSAADAMRLEAVGVFDPNTGFDDIEELRTERVHAQERLDALAALKAFVLAEYAR